MEEDVEIELLLKSNGKVLFEAAKEFNLDKNEESDDHKTHTMNSDEEILSSQNKENLLENMIHRNEKNLSQIAETIKNSGMSSQVIDADDTFNDQDTEVSKIQKKSLSIVSEGEDGCMKEASDQVNFSIFSLIANDPLKYYLSQSSYASQFEEEGDGDDYISSDEDWDDNLQSKDVNFIDKILEEPQFESLQTCQFTDSKSLQELGKKAVPALIMLGKMLFKRSNSLVSLENQMQQAINTILNKRKELQDKEVDKIKSREPGARCFFRKFGIPYFSDSRGFHPPPNKDHQQKLDNDELMIETVPKVVNWIKPHKEMMRSAIKKSLIAEKSAKLTKEITNLKAKLDKAETRKDDEVKKLQQKIIEKQNDLRGLYKKSLSELVLSEDDNKEYDWLKFSVSLFDGLHSAEECKRFWHLYLKPNINKAAWSHSEDSQLLEIGAKMNYQDWDKIAELLGTNRSAFQCFVHYRARLEGKGEFSSGKWTKSEDNKLLTIINSSKIGNFIPWTKISSYMNRDHSQVYNRWAHCLNPELVKGRFSKEEDLLIVSAVEVFGLSFKELASLMNSRTSSQLRERYVRHLLPKTAKVGTWSLEEDEKLLNLVQKHGAHNWTKVSDEMKTRTRTQVRQRYGFIKKMQKKNPGWTVAQVKRRNITFRQNKRVDQVVQSIKKDVEQIKTIFKLSEIEKETLLLEKLAELKDKIFCKKNKNKRGRRKREDSEDSEQNMVILDHFKNARRLPKPDKPLLPLCDDIDSMLNKLSLLGTFFGLTLKLPTSEEEIVEKRLNCACKSFLKCVLNTTPTENPSSRTTSELQISSSLHTNRGTSDSINELDYNLPEHDNTIIMRDWWHTPPVNVASLNFSEFFKRTVFDYSYGMHKDIWDSKVKRSQCTNTHNEYSVKDDGETHPTKYNFPPNLFTTLGLKSILVSRAVLERQSRVPGNSKQGEFSYFKKEIDEDENIQNEESVKLTAGAADNSCNFLIKLQSNFQSLFTWPQILSVIKIRTVPVQKTQWNTKKQDKSQNIVSGGNKTVLDSINDSNDDLHTDFLTDTLQRKKGRKPSAKLNVTRKNATKSQKLKIETLGLKRKLDNDSGTTVKKRQKRKCTNQAKY